jgi:hypothetical protein
MRSRWSVSSSPISWPHADARTRRRRYAQPAPLAEPAIPDLYEPVLVGVSTLALRLRGYERLEDGGIGRAVLAGVALRAAVAGCATAKREPQEVTKPGHLGKMAFHTAIEP